MQNETQKEIAGIQSASSHKNQKDTVYAQHEMLAYQQKESTARVASIMENTNLSKQQQVSEIMRQMLFFFSSRRRHTRSLRDWSSRRVLFRSRCVMSSELQNQPDSSRYRGSK